jgi:acyl carrier protein
MDYKVEDILAEFIRANCLPQKSTIQIGYDDHLFNKGILDSAGLLHFVGYIEKKFELEIPDEDLIPEKFTSITSIANYLRIRIEEQVIVE